MHVQPSRAAIELARRYAEQLGVALPDGQLHASAVHFELADAASAPQLLLDRYRAGALDAHALAVVLPRVWRAKPAGDSLPVDAWRELFREIRYTSDYSYAPRPRRPLRLFRGAAPERRSGLSWTARRRHAEAYAAQGAPDGTAGALWQVVAPPRHLWAYLPDDGEYVVDVRGLTVERAGSGPRWWWPGQRWVTAR